MSQVLTLFPARVAIVDPKTGLMTSEFFRALSVLFDRVGGAVAPSIPELPTDVSAKIAGEVFRQRDLVPPVNPADAAAVQLLASFLQRPQVPNNESDAQRVLAGQIFGA